MLIGRALERGWEDVFADEPRLRRLCRRASGGGPAVSGHSARAARALAHLGEVDPALAVLALWCRHRDGDGATRTDGDMISYGPGFDTLGPARTGGAGGASRVCTSRCAIPTGRRGWPNGLGDGFDASLFGLAADGIINEVLILAGHAVPRPAVTLTELLAEAGTAREKRRSRRLESWDADRLAMALHADPKRAERLRDWGATRGFAVDLGLGRTRRDGRDAKGRRLAQPDPARAGGGAQGGQRGSGNWGRSWLIWPRAGAVGGAAARADGARLDRAAPRRSWRRPLGGLGRGHGRGGTLGAGRCRSMSRDARGWMRGRGWWWALIPRPRSMRRCCGSFTAEAEGIARRTGRRGASDSGFDEAVFCEKRLDPLRLAGATRSGPAHGRGHGLRRSVREGGAGLAPSMLVVLTDLDAPLPPAPTLCRCFGRCRARSQPPPYGRVLVIGEG
jgi:hypothetical protein